MWRCDVETIKKMTLQNRELTRQQVGEDWFDLYLRPYPAEQVGFWSKVGRLFNFAARSNINVNILWRTAHAITLRRLRTGGASRDRHITREDVIRTEEEFNSDGNEGFGGLHIDESDLVPDTYVDADNQVWFDSSPPQVALNIDTLPRPLAQSQDHLHQVRNKWKAEQLEEAAERRATKSKRIVRSRSRTAPFATAHSTSVRSGLHDAYAAGISPREIKTTVRQETTHLMGQQNPTPELSILREWQPTSPPVVPIVPLTDPRLSQWIPDYSNLSQLQRDLLDITINRIRWSTNPATGLIRPRSFHNIKMATQDEISNEILRLRILVSYRAPAPPDRGRRRGPAPDNPYTAEENGRYFWMLGICHFFSALDTARDLWAIPDWLSVIHGHLAQINNAFPVERFSRLPIGDDISITLDQSSISLDQWAVNTNGHWQGWASDDLVFQMLRVYAIQYGYDEHRVQVVSPAVYRLFAESLDKPQAGLFVAPVIDGKADIVLIPVHRDHHWTLGIIDRRDGRTYMHHIDSMGEAFEEPYLRHLLNLNGFDTTNAQWTPHSGQVPRQKNEPDCGFWVMAHARQFLRNNKFAPEMETSQLRLSLLNDLWQAIQGRNAARNSEWRPTNEASTTGLHNNTLRSVHAIRREASHVATATKECRS